MKVRGRGATDRGAAPRPKVNRLGEGGEVVPVPRADEDRRENPRGRAVADRAIELPKREPRHEFRPRVRAGRGVEALGERLSAAPSVAPHPPAPRYVSSLGPSAPVRQCPSRSQSTR